MPLRQGGPGVCVVSGSAPWAMCSRRGEKGGRTEDTERMGRGRPASGVSMVDIRSRASAHTNATTTSLSPSYCTAYSVRQTRGCTSERERRGVAPSFLNLDVTQRASSGVVVEVGQGGRLREVFTRLAVPEFNPRFKPSPSTMNVEPGNRRPADRASNFDRSPGSKNTRHGANVQGFCGKVGPSVEKEKAPDNAFARRWCRLCMQMVGVVSQTGGRESKGKENEETPAGGGTTW
ncbi:hypothetical protein C8R46DRAFT_1042137 [Mycena filopes]|nr:hypothetical protein C8R46DRAFT_1042137 [Mycena filopes]